jgi:hypothetical protein
LQADEYPLKGALHHIFGILRIAKDAQGRAIGFALMTLVQFSEGVVVSGLGHCDERKFVAYALSTGGQRQASMRHDFRSRASGSQELQRANDAAMKISG